MKQTLPRRVINDIILALSSLDGYQEPFETGTGAERRIESRLVPLSFDADVRLKLAKNLGFFQAVEQDFRRQHADIVRSYDPVQDGESLRVPQERMAEFRRHWSAFLDGSQEVEIQTFPVEGLRGGSNRLPISLLAYLYALADETSLHRRFHSQCEDRRFRRSDAGLLLAALTGLEGRLVPHPDRAQKRQIAIPWVFNAEVREQFAYNYHILHRLGAEITSARASFQTSDDAQTADGAGQTAARWDAYVAEEVQVKLIPIRIEDLRLEVNAIPLSTLNQIESVLAPVTILAREAKRAAGA